MQNNNQERGGMLLPWRCFLLRTGWSISETSPAPHKIPVLFSGSFAQVSRMSICKRSRSVLGMCLWQGWAMLSGHSSFPEQTKQVPPPQSAHLCQHHPLQGHVQQSWGGMGAGLGTSHSAELVCPGKFFFMLTQAAKNPLPISNSSQWGRIHRGWWATHQHLKHQWIWFLRNNLKMGVLW